MNMSVYINAYICLYMYVFKLSLCCTKVIKYPEGSSSLWLQMSEKRKKFRKCQLLIVDRNKIE